MITRPYTPPRGSAPASESRRSDLTSRGATERSARSGLPSPSRSGASHPRGSVSACPWCGAPTEHPRGPHLEAIAAGRVLCSPCGRFTLHCSCEPPVDVAWAIAERRGLASEVERLIRDLASGDYPDAELRERALVLVDRLEDRR